MALPEIDAICRKCSTPFRDKPKRTFLGFQRLVCPHCKREVTYPLTSGYRTTYWIIVVLMVLVTISAIAQGQVASPGLIGFAMMWGLYEDSRIRREIKKFEGAATATRAGAV